MTITATEPMVLQVDEGDRGIEAFLTFGPDGRPGAALQVTDADYGSIGTDVAVSDGRLFAFTNGGESGFLAAFDLTTGHELWREGLDGSPFSADRGLHAEAGQVMFVNNSRHGDSLYVFDAATGDEKEHRDFRDDTEEVDDLLSVRGPDHRRPLRQLQRALHRLRTLVTGAAMSDTGRQRVRRTAPRACGVGPGGRRYPPRPNACPSRLRVMPRDASSVGMSRSSCTSRARNTWSGCWLKVFTIAS
ncbi:hypothetical protein ACF1BN_21950 [Streptomyces sp. NPDC014861]|uniref:hypothetical protein n=1 Tax=Streptomyces sp. NPDC014861 TaxID=3364923 RepID=UPI0036FA07BA